MYQPATYPQIGVDTLHKLDPSAVSPLAPDFTYERSLKRMLDVTIAVVLLIVLLPVMLLIGMMIFLESGGPVLFVQGRLGARRWRSDGFGYWQQSTFRMYKFRTMIQNQDCTLHRNYFKAFARGELDNSDADCLQYKMNHDPRVTRVGKILRKTSLDELPQLINVIKGEMSMVGPRPIIEYELEEYKGWRRERMAALPGLTGQWQVFGRSRVSFDEMVRMDINYVRNSSLLLDIKLILLTIPAVLNSRGAV